MSVRATVFALTVAALLLRAVTLDAQSFWADEAATVGVLRHSLAGVLTAVWDGESTPPLFYVLAWGWTQVAGTGEIGLRSLSAVLSAGSVPVVAALAWRVAVDGVGGALGGDRAAKPGVTADPAAPVDRERAAGRAAVGAGALAAVSPLMVWYGQEGRAYALLMLLVAGATLALLRALQSPSARRLSVWTALAVAAVWTHHFALFPVAAQAGWLLWVLRSRALAAAGALAVAVAALLPLLLHQREAGRASFIAEQSLPRRLTQIPKQVLTGYDGPAEVLLAVGGALAVLVALTGLAAVVRSGARAHVDGARSSSPSPAVIVISVTLAGVLLPVLAALAGQDFLLTRNVLGVLPLVLALLGAGAALLHRPPVGAAAIAALTVTGVVCAVAVAVHPAYQRDDFRAAIAAATSGPAVPRLVVADAEGRAPTQLYLGAQTSVADPGVPQTVREIDVVRVAGAQPGRERVTPSVPPAALPAPFVVAATARGRTWAVRRYVAPVPVAVDPSAIAAALSPGRSSVVLRRGR